jgi:transposase-like protein
VVRVRLDRKATSISLRGVIGVRADGQKVLLAVKSMGGESAEAWRAVLDDLERLGITMEPVRPVGRPLGR